MIPEKDLRGITEPCRGLRMVLWVGGVVGSAYIYYSLMAGEGENPSICVRRAGPA